MNIVYKNGGELLKTSFHRRFRNFKIFIFSKMKNPRTRLPASPWVSTLFQYDINVDFTRFIELLYGVLQFKAVPHSPNRLDILRLIRVQLHFLTNLFNMHRYCCNISNGFHIPNFTE